MLKITSSKNERIKKAVQLQSSRGRKQQGRFVVYGWREVERCIQSKAQICELFLLDTEVHPHPELIEQLLNDRRTSVAEITQSVFEKLAYGERTDGVVAVVDRPELGLAQLKRMADPVYMVLEGIEKPGNLGAIYRSCDGAGVDAILICDPLCDVFHPNAIRASMGTVFSIPTAVASSEETRDWLNGQQFQVLAARPDAAQSVFQTQLTGPLALVLGNEAKGLSDIWSGPTVNGIGLPMKGIADSLNVSATAAILAYEACRQRSAS